MPENPAVAEAVALIASIARSRGVDVAGTLRGVVDTRTALESLDRVALRLTQETRTRAASAAQASAQALLNDVRAAHASLLTHELARQRSMMNLVSSGLAGLRSAKNIDHLVESIPVQTVALGYERAMFSWVDNEHWVPRSMHTVSGPAEAQAILAAGAPPYAHTRDLMEIDVVRNRRAILVTDCEGNPRVHPKITPVSRSHTYVAAPIVARNHVAAFVHLDRNVDSGLNDEFDRDLLALFCEGVGAMLDSLLVSEQAVADGLLPHRHVSDWVEALTPREREVLRLVAEGRTNPQIGARLFVSPETAKSHVKKVMRKLGAQTRAEAGAMYHRLFAAGTGEPMS